MSLQEEIDSKRKQIRTDSYAMSIGEWLSLYERCEIDVHPEFQRFFRWKPAQKSKLIESIFLGIPIPPIFVAQREDGIWDVVDGVQRLSTIFQLAGLLKDEDGKLLDPLVLEETKYLPSMEGKTWDDADNEGSSLTNAQRLIIKRSKIDVSIIMRESDQSSKYELFQRLNTGGTHLSEQEIRNALLVMINRHLFLWLRDLACYAPFLEVLSLTDRALEERYEMDMALRFILLRSIDTQRFKGMKDINEFLTSIMIDMAEQGDIDLEREERIFKETFDVISVCGGSDLMRRFDTRRERFLGGFVVSAFESVALGVGFNIEREQLIRPEEIRERAIALWSDVKFTGHSGTGVRSSQRVPYTIPIGRRYFCK